MRNESKSDCNDKMNSLIKIFEVSSLKVSFRMLNFRFFVVDHVYPTLYKE